MTQLRNSFTVAADLSFRTSMRTSIYNNIGDTFLLLNIMCGISLNHSV